MVLFGESACKNTGVAVLSVDDGVTFNNVRGVIDGTVYVVGRMSTGMRMEVVHGLVEESVEVAIGTCGFADISVGGVAVGGHV